MPRGDGTGPQGKGPMSGRGAGRCSSNNRIAKNNRGLQAGLFSSLKEWFSNGNNRNPGRGMGRGRGRGVEGMSRSRIREMDSGFENSNRDEKPGTTAAQVLNRDRAQEEAIQLKEKARQMEEELNVLLKKINELESKKSLSQVLVDKQRCTACGRCEDICPRGAIAVREAAEVDPKLCTLCGACVNECPREALRIV